MRIQSWGTPAKRRISAMFLIGLCVAILSSTLLFAIFARRTALSSTLQYEMTVVDDIIENIDAMNDTAKSLLVQLYSNPNAQKILTYAGLSDVELTSLRAQLPNYYFTTPYMYSYYLINMSTRRVCTRNALYSFDSFSDQTLLDMLKQPESLQPYQCIVRYPASTPGGEETRYFTYIQYDAYCGVTPSSFIIINISEGWIRQKISDVCLTDERVLIFDEEDRLVLFNQEEEPDGAAVDAVLSRLTGDEGTFSLRWGGQSYVALHARANNDRWRIVRLIPSANIYAEPRQHLLIVVSLNLLVLAMCLLTYRQYAKRLLQPVDLLEKRLAALEKERPSLQDVVRRLIESSDPVIASKRLEELAARYGVRLRPDGPIRLGLCRIDDYHAFCECYNARTRSAMEFAIHNVARDMLEGVCLVDGVRTEPGDVLLFFSGFQGGGMEAKLENGMRQTQRFIAEQLSFGFSVAISDVGGAQDFHNQYDQLCELMDYRFYLGAGCWIVPADIAAATPAPMEQEWNLLQRFSESLRAYRYDSCCQLLTAALEDYARFEPADCLRLMEQGNALIHQHIYGGAWTDNQRRGESELRRLEWTETLADTCEAYRRLFRELEEVHSSEEAEKQSHADLTENVKAAVQRNYANANLSLQSLADDLGFSPAYLGRVFRRAEGCSVSAYINLVRLERVADMLAHTDQPVGSIAASCGIDNTAYLYTLFKKRYFMTPNEYRNTHAER